MECPDINPQPPESYSCPATPPLFLIEIKNGMVWCDDHCMGKIKTFNKKKGKMVLGNGSVLTFTIK